MSERMTIQNRTDLGLLAFMVVIQCPHCKQLGEAFYLGGKLFGSKGQGASWRCYRCGLTFETGPALTDSLLEGRNGYGQS